MKKWLPPHLLLLAGLSLLLGLQVGIREAAHDWEGEQIPRGDYILETFRQDEGETAMASFRVLAADGTEIYACPESWRTIDLKSIGWTGEGYDVQIISGDTGTVTYFHSEDGWQSEAGGRLALRAEKGEALSPSLLLAPVPLEEAVTGNLVGYARIRSDGWVFEWLESDYCDWTPEWIYQEEKVLISREGGQDCQSFEMWDYSAPDVDPEKKLLYEDVDFDGKPDLLVCTGHHGNQGYLTYRCFLRREDSFEECPSYTDIWFPTVDPENKRILSFQRNWAVSHSWGIYEFQDGEFVLTHWLTEEPAPDWQPTGENDYGNMIWQWTLDGETVGRSDTLTEEDIHQLFTYFGRS